VTAISFGLSCKLLSGDNINGTSEVECRKLLTDAIAKYGLKSSNREYQNLKCKSDSRHGCPDIQNDTKSLGFSSGM